MSPLEITNLQQQLEDVQVAFLRCDVEGGGVFVVAVPDVGAGREQLRHAVPVGCRQPVHLHLWGGKVALTHRMQDGNISDAHEYP